jgi:16S rRNA processing protein RimM
VVSVAKIVKEWGVKGEVKILPLSRGGFSFSKGVEVFLLTPQGVEVPAKIASSRKQGRYVILAIDNCPDATSAARLRASSICIPRDSLVLAENEFLCDQLIGLTVVTTDGEIIGQVNEIFETGSNDVYVVQKGNREYLLPAIRDVIQEIDLTGRRIIIKTMAGLLD